MCDDYAPQGSFATSNPDPSVAGQNAISQLDQLGLFLRTHFPEISNELAVNTTVVSVAMQIIERMQEPYRLKTGNNPDFESLDSQLSRLASYLLKEWNDHPAWVIDETCPNGKGAVDLTIAILKDCKAELATVDRSCPPKPMPAKDFGSSISKHLNSNGVYDRTLEDVQRLLEPASTDCLGHVHPAGDVTAQRLLMQDQDFQGYARYGGEPTSPPETPKVVIDDPNDPDRRRP